MWKNAIVSFTCERMQMYADVPNSKSPIFCSCLQNTSIMEDQESIQTPLEHISWFNRQVIQITYGALYKHLALLFIDSSQLCIYMTTPHILAPNVWKCCQDYFQSMLIQSDPSTSSIVYYYTKVMLSKNYFHWSIREKRAQLHKVTLTCIFMHQVILIFDDADIQLSVDFSYCWFNLVEVWYSLEQYIGL